MRSFGNNKFSSENICKQDQRVFVVPQRLYNLFWIDSMCLQKKKSPLKQTSDKTNSTSAAALCLVLHLLFHVENPFFLIFPIIYFLALLSAEEEKQKRDHIRVLHSQSLLKYQKVFWTSRWDMRYVQISQNNQTRFKLNASSGNHFWLASFMLSLYFPLITTIHKYVLVDWLSDESLARKECFYDLFIFFSLLWVKTSIQQNLRIPKSKKKLFQ